MKNEDFKQLKAEVYEDSIKGIMNSCNGYLISRKLTELDINRKYLKSLECKNLLKKIGPGIYHDLLTKEDIYYTFSLSFPNIVFSHTTSLYLQGLINHDKNISITVKKPYHNCKFVNCKTFYVDEDLYYLGLINIKTKCGNIVKAYDIERSICDIIKSKKRMNLDDFKHCIKTYFKNNNKNIEKLMYYAKKLNIEEDVMFYIEMI